MPEFFCLRDTTHFDDEKTVVDALKPMGKVHVLASFADLKKQLADYPPGQSSPLVIVLSTPPHKLAPLLADIRTVSATASCVALLNENEKEPPKPTELDCLLLRRPYDAYALQCQAAAAIRQSELLTSVTCAVQLDETTGLFNQHFFMKRLSAEISLAKRHLSPLTCVIFGIKYYQVFLDSYGYDFINRLIHHIGVITHQQLRTEDIAARIGDQEIALLLPRSTEKGARILTNRLLLTINGTPFKYNGSTEKITLYAGIAGYPFKDQDKTGQDKMEADTLVRFTHHALHSARFEDDGEQPEDSVSIRLFSEIQPVL